MKPKQYIKKYNLETSAFFDRTAFVDDFMADFKTMLGAVHLSPVTFKNVVSDLEIKFRNIFNGSEVTLDAADKFWNYIFASQIVPIRNFYFPDWKKAMLDHKLKTDPDFKRRYNCWQMHQEEDKFFNDMMGNFWEDLLHRFESYASQMNSLRYVKYEDVTAAKKTLGFSEKESPTVDEIKSRYRLLAMMTHPDKGGDDASFRALSEAKDFLMRLQSEDKVAV